MKKILKLKLMLVVLFSSTVLFGWETNTHRAIDRIAIENSNNLLSFVSDAQIGGDDEDYYGHAVFEGYSCVIILFILKI